MYTVYHVRDTFEEVFTHVPFPPDLTSSDYYLFAFAQKSFNSYEDVGKWLNDWSASK